MLNLTKLPFPSLLAFSFGLILMLGGRWLYKVDALKHHCWVVLHKLNDKFVAKVFIVRSQTRQHSFLHHKVLNNFKSIRELLAIGASKLFE